MTPGEAAEAAVLVKLSAARAAAPHRSSPKGFAHRLIEEGLANLRKNPPKTPPIPRA